MENIKTFKLHAPINIIEPPTLNELHYNIWIFYLKFSDLFRNNTFAQILFKFVQENV